MLKHKKKGLSKKKIMGAANEILISTNTIADSHYKQSCKHQHTTQVMTLLTRSWLTLIAIIPLYGSSAYAQFGGFSLPGLGGGGGGTDALIEQAKERAVSQIFEDIGKNAFEGGKLILSKKKWACQRLGEADMILSALSQASLSQQAAKLRSRLFCDITEAIPDELLSPDDPEEEEKDSQET